MSCQTIEKKYVLMHKDFMHSFLKEIKDYIKSCQNPKPDDEDDAYNPFDFIHKEKIMYLIYKEEKEYKVALRKQTVNILKPFEKEYEWYDVEPDSIMERNGTRDDPIPDKAFWMCCFYVYPHSSAYGALLYDDRPMKLFEDIQKYKQNRPEFEIFIVDNQCKVYDFTGNAKISDNIKQHAERTRDNQVCDITSL